MSETKRNNKLPGGNCSPAEKSFSSPVYTDLILMTNPKTSNQQEKTKSKYQTTKNFDNYHLSPPLFYPY